MVTLAANTGQRGGDLVNMRWTDIENYKGHAGINVTQQKTGKVLWVPFTQQLIEKMNAWERRLGFIVTKRNGEPWTRPHLSQEWWKELQKNESLAPLKAAKLSFHGLRASAVIRLRRAGCTEGEIASMVGMSVPMVSRYCRRSEQKDNALAALARLGTAGEQAKVIPFKSGG
jgi:integrase